MQQGMDTQAESVAASLALELATWLEKIRYFCLQQQTEALATRVSNITDSPDDMILHMDKAKETQDQMLTNLVCFQMCMEDLEDRGTE